MADDSGAQWRRDFYRVSIRGQLEREAFRRGRNLTKSSYDLVTRGYFG